MSSKILAGGMLVLALACSKQEEPAATPPAANPAAGTTTSQAGGGSAPLPGQNVNTGTPVEADATVTAPDTVGAGAAFETGWTGPGNSGDYIDLVPRGHAATSGEITYAYTKNAIPTAKLLAPTTPGAYEVRYVLQLDGVRKVKAARPLTVAAVSSRLTVPASAGGAEPITVAWEGPGGAGDYIDIVPAGQAATSGEVTYAYTRAGNPAALTAPTRAGVYEVRYILEGPGGRKVLFTAPLTVTQPAATLDAPVSAAAGSKFKVVWTGPKRRGDYVDLVPKGHTATSGETAYFYATESTSSELNAPAQAGEYEIRYLLEGPGGRQILARRPIRVQ